MLHLGQAGQEEHLGHLPIRAAVRCMRCSFPALPVPDAAFDLVVCQQGLQFFSDRATALAEIRRATKPGGWVALSVWQDFVRCPGFARLAAVLIDHVGPRWARLCAPRSPSPSQEYYVACSPKLASSTRASPAHPGSCAITRQHAPSARTRGTPLTDDDTATMCPYPDDDATVFPMEAHVAAAPSP